ncbi:MAG: CCA tRNA nucleotidyltransferase [bacterium]
MKFDLGKIEPLLSSVPGWSSDSLCASAKAEGSRRERAFIVGGYVRDLILGGESDDIDFAIRGDALRSAKEFADAVGGSFVLLDGDRFVARVVCGGKQFDFAAFRGENIEDDLRGRDFTINALALNHRGELIDPFGGLRDLRRRVIRHISPSTFDDDPLRILRGVRLGAELGFSIDGGTLELMGRKSHLLREVAGERIRDELCKILSVPASRGAILTLDSIGAIRVVMPELWATKGVTQNNFHHLDVWEHSLESLRQLEEKVLVDPDILPNRDAVLDLLRSEVVPGRNRLILLKLATLLHDIGKPPVRVVEGDRIRFLGHDKAGGKMAEDIAERLRFGRREVRMISASVLHHMRPGFLSGGGEGPSDRAIYRFFRKVGEVGVECLVMALADGLAIRGVFGNPKVWEELQSTVNCMLSIYFEEISKEKPPRYIDGRDIMDKFHLKPGRLIGRLLEGVSEATALGEVTNKDEALAFVENLLRSMGEKEVDRSPS